MGNRLNNKDWERGRPEGGDWRVEIGEWRMEIGEWSDRQVVNQIVDFRSPISNLQFHDRPLRASNDGPTETHLGILRRL